MSNRRSPCFAYTFFNLSLFGCFEPPLDFIYFLILAPFFEIDFGQIHDLPVFVAQELGRQLLLLTGLFGLGADLFLHVVLDSYLLIPKDIM